MSWLRVEYRKQSNQIYIGTAMEREGQALVAVTSAIVVGGLAWYCFQQYHNKQHSSNRGGVDKLGYDEEAAQQQQEEGKLREMPTLGTTFDSVEHTEILDTSEAQDDVVAESRTLPMTALLGSEDKKEEDSIISDKKEDDVDVEALGVAAVDAAADEGPNKEAETSEGAEVVADAAEESQADKDREGQDVTAAATLTQQAGASEKAEESAGEDSTISDEEFEQKLKAALVAPRQADMESIFDEIDKDHNGMLSVKEVEQAMFKRKARFSLKPAIVLRAFEKADTDKDGAIERDEFFFFLRMTTYYKNLYNVFELMDTNHDRQLSKDEFFNAAAMLKLDDPEKVWEEMDTSHHGYVVFDEFCLWMAEKHA